MNIDLQKKENGRKVFVISITVMLLIAIVILFRRSNTTNIETYNPDNSYIISSEQINSKVADESEARKLLTNFELGDEYLLMGTFDLNGGIVYRFQESYDGIPVHGRYSNVITSVDTTAEGISSNYYPVYVDTTPKIDSDKALSICNQYFSQADIVRDNAFIELCIYGYDEMARLSYCIYVGNNSIYIDANSGNIIQVFDNMRTLDCMLTGNLGEVEVNVQENSGSYELLDVTRGGGIESCVLSSEDEGTFDLEQQNRTRVVISQDNADDFKSSVDAYYNIECTYDYYADMHHFYSTDGHDNRVIHIINNIDAYTYIDNGEKKVKNYTNNAASTTRFNTEGIAETWFLISKENNRAEHLFSYYLDVMTHEYTHAVMDSVIGGAANRQMEAMGEAYSDIMGECCEAFYNLESDWNIPGCRNIANIADNIYEGTNINHMDQYSDDLDEHEASTVISSAAYYMYVGVDEEGRRDSQYAIHSYEALSKLWFASLFYLTPSSDFLTCRCAVESAANLMIKEGLINELQLQGIRNAFDKVGIQGSPTGTPNDFMNVSPDFEIQIKDKEDRNYEDCDIIISCVYKGHDYKGHNIGILYRTGKNEYVYEGAFKDYLQQKINYEVGAIYSIDLKDQNSLFEETFIFEVKKKGAKELVLHTSFLGSDFNPFKKEQSDNTLMQEEGVVQGGFVLTNPYPEEYQSNETAFDNLFSGHFANMSAPMGLESGCTYESSKRFALKASYDMEDPINGAYYLMIADVLGNVYDMFPISQYPRAATGWIKDDIFYCSDSSSVYIMKQGGDITGNFFDDHTPLIDIVNGSNGILFFTARTVFDSPYDSADNYSSDTRYDIWDEAGNIILSFYKNEMVNKYGTDSWVGTGRHQLINLGSGIYHVAERQYERGHQYIFIDVNRKKAFAVPVNGDAEYENIETDGNYILIPHSSNDVTIFDIETEESMYLENISKAYGLGEGKFFTDMYCYSVWGDILFSMEDVNVNGYSIKAAEAYHDGQALVIIGQAIDDRETCHEYDIGFMDESGDVNVITRIKDTYLRCSYIYDLDIYCIFGRKGIGGFLSNKGIFQKQTVYGSSYEDIYYSVIDNGNQLIFHYGYVEFGYELFKIN